MNARTMTEEITDGKDTDRGEWGHRRRHLRHEVDVPARIMGQMDAVYDCRICDISSSGMLLSYDLLVPEGGREPLKEGSDIVVRFAPDAEHSPDYFVTFEVRIMWKTPHGIGVRFRKVGEEQKAALRVLAQMAVAERARAETEARKRSARAPVWNKSKVMSGCRKTLERHLPNMTWTLRTEVVRRLHQLGEDHPELRETVAAEAATIDSKANAIGRSVERQLMLAVAEMAGLDDTQEMVLAPVRSKIVAMATGRPAEEAEDEMGMVENDQVAQSAALAAAVQHIEDALKSRVFELNIRLANVLAQKLDTTNNPLLPARLCRTLWESVTEHVDNANVRRCLRETFRSRMLPLLSDLYGELHKTLDAHDVPGAFRQNLGKE